jgi:hypothetical protein
MMPVNANIAVCGRNDCRATSRHALIGIFVASQWPLVYAFSAKQNLNRAGVVLQVLLSADM